jgi:hypothetical protein
MAPYSAFLGAGRQKHFQASVSEYVGSHIPAVGDQSRGTAKASLQTQECTSNGFKRGNRRRAGAASFCPNRCRNILTCQPNFLFPAVIASETHIEPACQLRQGIRIVQLDTSLLCGQCDQPIQSPTIEQVPAQFSRYAPSDRAFPGSAGSVDR